MIPPALATKLSQFDFQYETVRFHPKIALTLAKASKLTYFPEKDVRPIINSGWNCKECHFFSVADTQCYVIANDQVIIVAFRGSDSVADWMDNLDVCLDPGPFGKLHRGFQAALSRDRFWDHHLLPLLRSMQKTKARSLWMTGHSLGAGLAIVATARLRVIDVPVYGLYTYGAPRVGNRDFERTFNADFKSRTFRYINNNDTVTRIPTREMGYSHVGNMLYFTKDGVIKSDPYFWLQFLDRIQGRMDVFLKPGLDEIRDHDLDQYLGHLEKNLSIEIKF